jgi:hypothetical protein
MEVIVPKQESQLVIPPKLLAIHCIKHVELVLVERGVLTKHLKAIGAPLEVDDIDAVNAFERLSCGRIAQDPRVC